MSTNPSEGIDGRKLRQCILEVVAEFSKQGSGYFQVNPILGEVANRLGRNLALDMQQAVLTVWHDLFRTGLLAWGYNLANPSAPFCHLTETGRQTLKHVSRDPANPDGYFGYLDSRTKLDTVSRSYLEEAVICYNSGCYKAAAVMVGATAESLVLLLRDSLVNQLTSKGQTIPPQLTDWWIKTVRDQMTTYLDSQKGSMPRELRESFDAFWAAFAEQIRRVRNDAGHPAILSPVTPESVHASLLIVPELSKLIADLDNWLK